MIRIFATRRAAWLLLLSLSLLSAKAAAPDLIFTTGISVTPNPIVAGNNLTVSYTVKNNGNANAAQSTARIQVKLGSSATTTTEVYDTTPALAVGASSARNVTVPIPGSVAAGGYTVYVILDYNNAIGQSDTSNASDIRQTTTGALTIQAGSGVSLAITAPSGGETWFSGTAQAISWSVSGTPPSPISYFQIDYSLDGGNSWSLNAVYAAASANSATWYIPSGLASTQARIRVRAVNSAGSSMFWGISANNFTISQPVGKPTAVPDANNLAPVSGQSVSFTGINSIRSAPTCGIASYVWDFGDGTSGTGVDINHVFPASASGTRTYKVDLTVTDCYGKQDTKSLWVTVTGRALGTPPAQSFSADPVNLATGNYIYEHVDLKLPGMGIPFEFKRFYNSKAPDVPFTPHGPGWTHSYNIFLATSVSNSVIVTFGDGHKETYATNGIGGYLSEPGVYHSLTQNGNATFTLSTKEQLKYNFNQDNRLSTIEDKNGNAITLNYAGGNLTSIIDTAGRTIQITYDGNNRITRIADPAGRTVTFTNDASGDLTSATDPNGNTTVYGYDAQHQMTTATDPKGNVFVRNVYDAQRRVVNFQKDALNYETGFGYDFVARITTVTNTLGQKSYHQHDEKLRVVSITDELGNAQSFEYDENNNRTKVIDKNGRVTVYMYDAAGNVTLKTDPDSNVTRIEYDSRNNPVKRIDALGQATTYAYDEAGNLISTTNALSLVSNVSYDGSGLPLVLMDANGHKTTNSFDAQGNLLKVQDSLGNITAYGYDVVGRKLAQTNANNQITRYLYDNNDNLVGVVDPLNRTNTSIYDQNNNRIVTIDARGAATTKTFDAKDRLVSTRNALGGITVYEYDSLDRRVKVTDARGGVTKYGFDAVGNLIAATNALNQVTRYTYDPNGNRTSVIDPLGQITTNIYDNLNRLVMTIDPLGHINQTVYDALGRRIQAIDALNRTNQFTYDALGRPTQTTDPTGGTAKFGYDSVGNRIVTTDPKNQSVTNSYNDLNRLIETREAGGGLYQFAYDGVGNLTNRIDAKGQSTRYTYDGSNRRTTITYPSGTPVTFSYDENGNLVAMNDSLGTTTYSYDSLNRLTNVTDAFGKSVSYTYDPNGNRTSITYPGGKQALYTYDALNRMASVTDWLGGVTTYHYDETGNLAHTENPNASTVDYSYDPASRLIGLTNTAPNGTPISSYRYTLDAVGNHSQVSQIEPLDTTPVLGNFTYTYDADNRLTSAEGEPHVHDANGNMTALNSTNLLNYDFADRVTKTIFAATTNLYQYDGAGNRKEANRNGEITRYVLDLNSSLSQVLAETDANGNTTAYYVYGLGLVSQIKQDGTAFYYHFDSRGSTIAMTDAAGALVNAYAYDPFGRIRDSKENQENHFRYLGRHGIVDEGNGFSYIRARYYSVRRGRFITKDPLTGKDGDPQSLNRYIYALNNPVRLIDISGLSPQEASGTIRSYATSDTSLLHNYLISPGTSGLAVNIAGTTPQVGRVGRGSGFISSVVSESAQELASRAIEQVSKIVVNNNGFNSAGSIAYGIYQGAGPLVGGISSAYGAYTDTIAHPERNNYEVLARFNIDLVTGAAVGAAGVAALALGAPAVAVVAGTILVGAVIDTYHEPIQNAAYNGVQAYVNGVDAGMQGYLNGINSVGNYFGGLLYNAAPGLFQ